MNRRPREEDASASTEAVESLTNDLMKLYEPKEGPSYMNGRFEAALRQRSVIRLKRWLSSCRIPSPRPLTLAAALIGAIAIAAAAAALMIPGSSHSPSVAEASAFLTQTIPDRLALQPGDVLHMRVEHESAFVTGTDSASLPHVTESWIEVGPGDTVVRSVGRIIDSVGAITQQTVYKPGIWRTTDPRTGVVIRDDPYVPQQLNGPKERAHDFDQALTTGKGRVLSQTATTLTIELSDDLGQAAIDNPPSGLEQLAPTAIVQRITIRSDGAVLSAETYAVTKTGKRVLVRTDKTTTFEVLTAMPAGLF